jgi:hypothetical protein
MELFIGHSALHHLDPLAIEPVRDLLLEFDEETYDGEQWDLRYHLIATASVMNQRFPEYEAWHKEALATNYGWTKLKNKRPVRLADAFADKNVKSRSQPTTIYQLKITLKDIKPPIWRRLLVADCTLDDLHEIIQVAMGWENAHLYAFRIGGEEFSRPDMDEGELDMEDATSTLVGEVITGAKQKFEYEYDFGDGWEHTVLVEKVTEPEPGQQYPLCVKGSRACPPEDIGGPWGYAQGLEAMADPHHKQHDEFSNWPDEFDPEAFDVAAVNRELRKAFK